MNSYLILHTWFGNTPQYPRVVICHAWQVRSISEVRSDLEWEWPVAYVCTLGRSVRLLDTHHGNLKSNKRWTRETQSKGLVANNHLALSLPRQIRRHPQKIRRVHAHWHVMYPRDQPINMLFFVCTRCVLEQPSWSTRDGRSDRWNHFRRSRDYIAICSLRWYNLHTGPRCQSGLLFLVCILTTMADCWDSAEDNFRRRGA